LTIIRNVRKKLQNYMLMHELVPQVGIEPTLGGIAKVLLIVRRLRGRRN